MFYRSYIEMEEFVKIDGSKVFLNQTGQITDRNDLYVILDIQFKEATGGKVEFLPQLIQ